MQCDKHSSSEFFIHLGFHSRIQTDGSATILNIIGCQGRKKERAPEGLTSTINYHFHSCITGQNSYMGTPTDGRARKCNLDLCMEERELFNQPC